MGRLEMTSRPAWLRDVFELRARKGIGEDGRLFVEGTRLIAAARAAGLPFECLLYTPEFWAGDACRALCEALQRSGVPSHCLAPRTFSQLSYKAEGLCAVVRFAPRALDDVVRVPCLVVLDGLADPGNIGAALRCANAWGPAGVVVVGMPGKLFHPKALRASMGAVFHTPVCTAERALLIERVAELGAPVIALAPAPAEEAGADPWLGALPAGDVVLVLGNERHGVHPLWHAVTRARLSIPMTGIVDSLNVATTAAIVLWELFRSRAGGARASPPA